MSSQFHKRLREPVGQPFREWINNTPNDGIIRYLDVMNIERLVVTKPKALAEVLVHKSYEFIKPWSISSGIGRIFGIGLLLAEGDEHKVCRYDYKAVSLFIDHHVQFVRSNEDNSVQPLRASGYKTFIHSSGRNRSI